MEALWKETLDNLAQGVAYQDADGRIQLWNKTAEDIFGLTAERNLDMTPAGRPWDLIYSDGSHCPDEEHPSRLTLKTGKPFCDEIRGIKRPDGSVTWLSINTNPLRHADDEPPYAVILSFSDISARKREHVSEDGQHGQPDGVPATGRHGASTAENEAHFRNLVENWPDEIIRYDRNCRRVYINPFAKKQDVLRYQLGRTPLETFPGSEQMERYQQTLREVLETGVVRDFEMVRSSPGRETEFLLIHLVPERDAKGNVSGVFAVARDVSEQKRAERQRLASLKFFEGMDKVNRAVQGTDDLEQMLSDLLDELLDIFDCDRAYLLYPCDPDSPTWTVPMERTKPEYPGAMALGREMPMQSCTAEASRLVLNAGGPVRFDPQSGNTLPRETSERFGFKSYIAMALFPKVGKPWEFGLHQCSHPRVWTPEDERLFQEIGHRLADALSTVLAHRSLRESEQRYHSLVDQAADALFMIDDQGRILDTNQVACERLGYTREELLRLRISDIDPQVKPMGHKEVFWEKLGPGHSFHFESQHRRKDGTTFPVEVSLGLLTVGDRRLMLGLGRDITERKQAEKAMQRLNRELRAVSSCNKAMIRAADENSLLAEICRIFCQEAGYRLTWVGYAENDDAKTVRPVAWAGHDDGYLENANFTWADMDRGRGPIGMAIRDGIGVCVQDYTTDSRTRSWRAAALRRGYLSNLALPLKDEKGKTFGVLAIYSAERNAFTPDEIRLLEEMAEDLAFGIIAVRTRDARKLAEEELRLSERNTTIFNQIANIFLTVPDEDMYEEVLAVIRRVMKSEFGIFGYLDETGDLVAPSLSREVWGRCQVPEKSITFPAGTWGHSLWGRAIREQTALYSNAAFVTPPGHIAIDSFLAVPLVFGGQTIGLLSVANKAAGYTEADKELLEGIANNISPILNARLQRDLQERKRVLAERSLAAREGELRTLVENVPDLLVRFDRQGRHIFVSPSLTKLTGLPAQAFIGKTFAEIMPDDPKAGDYLSGMIKRAVETKSTVSGDLTWRTGKTRRFSEIRYIPELDDMGEVISVLGIGHDLSERKRAEEEKGRLEAQLRQAQKMEAIGTLAGGIAHDFNNILAAILGYSEISLLKAEAGKDNVDELQKVLIAVERARDLVRQILTFSRKMEVEKRPLDLNRTIQDALDMLERTLPKMISIETDLGSDLKPVVANATRMEQVVMNLATNAADAMPDGGRLSIKTRYEEVSGQLCATCGSYFSGSHVVLTVSDTGHGMDPAIRERIFEPFFTTKSPGKGTGMGLSTIYGIVTENGGHITCDSQPGQGTTFRIYLPCRFEGAEASPAQALLPRVQAGRGEIILLVDDEEAIRDLGARILEGVGYRVVTAGSGEDALAEYRRRGGRIDLVLLDLNMPGMGGARCLESILALEPHARVVIISGYLETTPTWEGLRAGAAGFVQKPFGRVELLNTVRGVLDKVDTDYLPGDA